MISFPGVEPKIKELEKDEFESYQEEAKSALQADEQDRMRCIQNISAFTGLNFAQWPTDILQSLLGDNRKPDTHNLLEFYVQGLAGNYIANWFDPKFVATRDRDIDTVGELQRVYYILKDLYSYKNSSLRCLINGLCYRGVEEIVVDRSKDPRGELRFVSWRPDLVVFDPSCYDDDISGKAKRAWTYAYLLPSEMVSLFRTKADKILNEVKQQKKRGGQYKDNNFVSLKNMPHAFGDRKQVIQYYHIETEKKTFEFDTLTLKMLPETDDVKEKMDWAGQNGVDLGASMSNGKLISMTKEVPVLWTTIWCPEYKILLENRKDERQLNGRLPLYDWSYITKNGKSIGLVDIMFDPQVNFNKLQVAKRQFLTQGHQGKLIIHEDAFGGDIKAKTDFVDQLADISRPGVLPTGSPPPANVLHELRGAEPAQVLYQCEQLAMNFMQMHLPPVMQGRSEIQGESGIHYGRKVIEASITQRVPMETIMEHELAKAEGWVIMAPKVFGGPHNLNRQFIAKESGLKAMLNVDGGYNFDSGERIVQKDISNVERINVTISASKENDFLRQAKRELDAIVLQSMNVNDPTNIGIRAVYEGDLVLNSDFTDLEQKEAAYKAVKKREELVNLQMDTLIAQARAASFAAQQALKPTVPTQAQGAVGLPAPAINAEEIQPAEQLNPERPPVAEVKGMM